MISSLMNMAKLSQFAKICYMCIKVCFFSYFHRVKVFFCRLQYFWCTIISNFLFFYVCFNLLRSSNFRLSSLNLHSITDLVHYFFCYLLRDRTVFWVILIVLFSYVPKIGLGRFSCLFFFLNLIEVVVFYDY